MSENDKRPRNSEVTKAAILDAARTAFAENSYDVVGLREIARVAEVNVSLVIRYFGSKERLFSVCLEEAAFDALLRDVPRERLAEVLGRFALHRHPSDETMPSADDGMDAQDIAACYRVCRMLICSINSRMAAPLIRARLESDLLYHLVERIGGSHAREKGRLVLALLIGLALTRGVLDGDGTRGGVVKADSVDSPHRAPDGHVHLAESLLKVIIDDIPINPDRA